MKRLLCLSVALAACAHAHTEVKVDPKMIGEYYPLSVGNSWTYDGQMLGGAAKIEVSIVKAEQGKFIDSQGNEMAVDGYGIHDAHRYLLRGPLEVGTKWNNVISVSSYEQYAIVEAGQNCVAPAGTFQNCVVVESSNRGEGQNVLINTLTFAPKVGIIRMATELAAPDGRRIPQSKLELVAFKVGSGAP